MSDLGFNEAASYAFGGLSLLGALYVCFGRSILNVAIALLITLAALAGLLLTLGLEYLALVMAFVAVLAPVVLVSFASSIVGDLGRGSLEEKMPSKARLTRIAGFLTGLLCGGLLSVLLVHSSPLFAGSSLERANADGLKVGKLLLGEHVVVFQVLTLGCLGVVMGVGTLLRRRSDP